MVNVLTSWSTRSMTYSQVGKKIIGDKVDYISVTTVITVWNSSR